MPPSLPPTSSQNPFTAHDLRDAWAALSWAERKQGFQLLSRVDAEEVFLNLVAYDQARLILHLPAEERRMWIRLLPPDDAADVLQGVPTGDRDGLLALLDEPTRKEVNALLAHAEDAAGGLMNPRFARVRPEMTVDEAIGYIRKQARERVATIYYVYVLDPEQHLLGAVSFRELFAASAEKTVSEIMRTDVARLTEKTGQREVASLFAKYDLLAMPVVDTHGHMVVLPVTQKSVNLGALRWA